MKKYVSLIILNFLFFKSNCQNRDSLFIDGHNKLFSSDFKGAVQAFTRCIEVDSTYSPAFKERSSAFFVINKYNNALADFHNYMKLKDSLNVSDYIYLGDIYFKSYEFDSSSVAYRKALEMNIDGNNGYLYLQLAYIQFKRDNIKDAILTLTECFNRYPDSDIYYYRGNLLFQTKDYNAAIKDYDAAIKRKTNVISAYFQKGVALYKLGNKKLSIENINTALLLGFIAADYWHGEM